MTFIDSHHHLWDMGEISYPWLEARGSKRFFGQPDPIRKNYLPKDYQSDHQQSITTSVHIQVGCIEEHNVRESQLIETYIEQGAPIGAIVAAVDVRQKNLEQQLLDQSVCPHVKGVRHMIGKSPTENHLLPEFVSEEWLSGWSLISDRGLTFDLQLTEEQYQSVFQALRQVPELKVVLCHFASPWDQSADGFSRWQLAMRQFASLKNCHIKLSGFSMFTHNFNQQNFLKYANAAIDIFGAERCMLGSNFPVDKLHMGFDQLIHSWQTLCAGLDIRQSQQIRVETARNFYQLK
ncbi:amidohydrolase family protein [Thalassotalea sp. PS06]|uniref:amidohydrolase family protein n=1 Tax=Thalassotalea sp. PS06 TaxID=2594005 RepID=UPI001162C783|nr:amidohydrolase family protein [Thalassotalea sp. PS06]QDP00997.1 amidohydrolase family protein [Thalassotalea sp. PS06]